MSERHVTATSVLTAGEDDDGRRLDRVLRRALPHLGLSQLHRALRVGEIRCNGKRCRPSDRVARGDTITLRRAAGAEALPAQPHDGPAVDGPIDAEQTRAGEPLIDGRIILETDHILALHKRRGTLVHGEHSLDEAVGRYLAGTLPPSLSFRPGPLHRLDRNSSGLILFGKSIQGARRFSELLQAREVHKSYLALFTAWIGSPLHWTKPLSRNPATRRSHAGARGESATTAVRPLAHGRTRLGEPLTLALCEIRSGRTHQIRAHAAAEGAPLAGDAKYGGGSLLGGYILHALAIELERPDPVLGFRRLVDPPEDSIARRLEMFLGAAALDALSSVVQQPSLGLHFKP